jgi:hypothetical protein
VGRNAPVPSLTLERLKHVVESLVVLTATQTTMSQRLPYAVGRSGPGTILGLGSALLALVLEQLSQMINFRRCLGHTSE